MQRKREAAPDTQHAGRGEAQVPPPHPTPSSLPPATMVGRRCVSPPRSLPPPRPLFFSRLPSSNSPPPPNPSSRYGARGEVISLVTKRQSKAAEALQEALSSKKQIHALDYTGKLSSTEDRLPRGAERAREFEPRRADGGAVRGGGHRMGSEGMQERESLRHSRAFPYPLDYRQSVRREERRLERRERTWHAGREERTPSEGRPLKRPSEREGERLDHRRERHDQRREPRERRQPRADRRAPPPLPDMATLRGGRGGPGGYRNGPGPPRKARAAW